MPLSHKKIVARAHKTREKIVDQIYALAPNWQTKFSDCMKLASPELRAAYDESLSAYIKAEYDAIAAGKAYRSESGMFVWSR